jgi:hypothetical protein
LHHKALNWDLSKTIKLAYRLFMLSRYLLALLVVKLQ